MVISSASRIMSKFFWVQDDSLQNQHLGKESFHFPATFNIEDCSRRWRLRARSSVAGGKIFLKRSRNKRRQATKDLRLRGHLRVAIWLILSNMLMPTAKMSSLTFLWSDANIFPVRPTTVLISSHIIWALNAVQRLR